MKDALERILALCNRFMIMRDGRVVALKALSPHIIINSTTSCVCWSNKTPTR